MKGQYSFNQKINLNAEVSNDAAIIQLLSNLQKNLLHLCRKF